jgi:transposase
MRPHGSAALLEYRRRLAVRLLEQGLETPEVAEALCVSQQSVRRWLSAWRVEAGSLAAVPHRGAAPKLNDPQTQQVLSWLEKIAALAAAGARAAAVAGLRQRLLRRPDPCLVPRQRAAGGEGAGGAGA